MIVAETKYFFTAHFAITNLRFNVVKLRLGPLHGWF